jgi:hypothetical protein
MALDEYRLLNWAYYKYTGWYERETAKGNGIMYGVVETGGFSGGASGALAEEGFLFRRGGTNPGSLKLRPGEEGLSFRDTLSNPIPKGERPVFDHGADFIKVDASKLPAGSFTRNGVPPGHVSVTASAAEIKAATVGKGCFPK